MISLDLADLVVIAGRTLDLDERAVLERFDLAAGTAALAEAAAVLIHADGSAAADGSAHDGQADAAAAGVALVRALAVHRPVTRDAVRLAAASGLQFLSVNGWRAELEPPETAAVVMEAVATGRLSRQVAADWLAPRLSPIRPLREQRRRGLSRPPREPKRAVRRPAPRSRGLISTLIAVGIGGLALLTTACTGSLGNDAPAPAPVHHAVVVSPTGR